MPIGVAATLIGSAIAGGSALGSAKIQSNAAKNAQQAQQTATDKALAVQQQANAPYLALGQQGASRLSALTAGYQPYSQQFTGPGGSNGVQPTPQGPMTLGGIGQPPGGGMVTLQAPDGSTRQFPQAMAMQVMQQARQAGHELRQV